MFDLEFKPYLLTFLWTACLALVLLVLVFGLALVFGGALISGLLFLAAVIGFFIMPAVMALRRLLRERDGLYTGRMAWRFAVQAAGLTLLVLLPVLLALLLGGGALGLALSDVELSQLWRDPIALEVLFVLLSGVIGSALAAAVGLALVCRAVFWTVERRIAG